MVHRRSDLRSLKGPRTLLEGEVPLSFACITPCRATSYKCGSLGGFLLLEDRPTLSSVTLSGRCLVDSGGLFAHPPPSSVQLEWLHWTRHSEQCQFSHIPEFSPVLCSIWVGSRSVFIADSTLLRFILGHHRLRPLLAGYYFLAIGYIALVDLLDSATSRRQLFGCVFVAMFAGARTLR